MIDDLDRVSVADETAWFSRDRGACEIQLAAAHFVERQASLDAYAGADRISGRRLGRRDAARLPSSMSAPSSTVPFCSHPTPP
jgi:hypothetical protein